MSDRVAAEFDLQDRISKQNRLKACAANIENINHLRLVLVKFPTGERKAMFDLLKPYLKFGTPGFSKLMRTPPKVKFKFA